MNCVAVVDVGVVHSCWMNIVARTIWPRKCRAVSLKGGLQHETKEEKSIALVDKK